VCQSQLARTLTCTQDYFNLEVYVYEEEQVDEEAEVDDDSLPEPGNIFVHHDVMLPDFALSQAWIGANPGKPTPEKGNFVAVTTAAPMIEVWNLDILNAMEPAFVLGGAHMAAEVDQAGDRAGKKGKKGKKGKQGQTAGGGGGKVETGLGGVVFEEGSHRDSVLGLSWNPARHHILASCSADKTVKVWDTCTRACLHTFSHHTDKVQAVEWNPTEPAILLSGSFDKRAAVVDVRVDSGSAAFWPLPSDTERVAWNPHASHNFFVSLDTGEVLCFDARAAGSEPVFRFQAHRKECSVMEISAAVPHMMMTASVDKTLKIWDIADGTPTCVCTNDKLDAGAIFAAALAPDEPFYVAAAGAKGILRLWDSLSSPAVRRRFEGRVPELTSRKGRKLPLQVNEDQ
jgi:periodic tryptophan protein 1